MTVWAGKCYENEGKPKVKSAVDRGKYIIQYHSGKHCASQGTSLSRKRKMKLRDYNTLWLFHDTFPGIR